MASVPDLTSSIESSLAAKLDRLLRRPLVASIEAPHAQEHDDDDEFPELFQALLVASLPFAPNRTNANRPSPWLEDPEDGTCTVQVSLDYDDRWRGCEKEILETLMSTIESDVTFLTEEQKHLLECSPHEFLTLTPPPESSELISFARENVGGSVRLTSLTVAAAPESYAHIKYVAIIPNLVQLERQLDALRILVAAQDDGPLAPLRMLVGLADVPEFDGAPAEYQVETSDLGGLDEYQRACVQNALTSPHFSVIQGPPGSGKTTVISTIVQKALAAGQRVLVVSPTHVAVDNVVEKLATIGSSKGGDQLEPRSLPLRYAARKMKLSASALRYWVGRKKQHRAGTISLRLQSRLCEMVPFASSLYAMEDTSTPARAPLSAAIASVEQVICGTPIGILSCNPVKTAPPGTFDILIVDEVSKMTLPEFLAVAVKARRWVLVGDPEQLPPYNNCEENGTSLDDVIHPLTELVCSVGVLVDRTKISMRHEMRAVVVTNSPELVAQAIRSHLRSLLPDARLPVCELADEPSKGIIVCMPSEYDEACRLNNPVRARDRQHSADSTGTIRVLVERGLRIERPRFASGLRLVEPRERAQAQIFENSFNVYHARPWSVRSKQKLQPVLYRNGLEKYLPSAEAIQVFNPNMCRADALAQRTDLISAISERFAVNTVSVYDWLTGIPVTYFDVSPLQELASINRSALCARVEPFVGKLKRQYRMHPSLSRIPRELFYFGEALVDAQSNAQRGSRVNLVQVHGSGPDSESNDKEVKVIGEMLESLNGAELRDESRPRIMIITPYRAQETQLTRAVDDLRRRGNIDNLEIDVCTLDRCQGREAEYVLISLVRGKSTPFLDMPKRWNVALTRAMKGLFIVGNIETYLDEAYRARQTHRSQGRELLMSLVARFIEAYDLQIAQHGAKGPGSASFDRRRV